MFERGEECFSPACICVCQCCGSFWLPGIAESGLPHLRAPLDFGLVWGSLLIGLASDSSQSSCRSCFGFESVQLLSVLWTGASTVRRTASEPFHEDGLQQAHCLLLRNKEVWEKLRIAHLRVSNPEPWLGRRTPSWQSQPGDFRVVSATWKPSCCNGNREFPRCSSGVPPCPPVGAIVGQGGMSKAKWAGRDG